MSEANRTSNPLAAFCARLRRLTDRRVAPTAHCEALEEAAAVIERLSAERPTDETTTKPSFLSYDDAGGVTFDVAAYLRTPEGQAQLAQLSAKASA